MKPTSEQYTVDFGGLVRILMGTDGFRTLCTECLVPAGPFRTTLAVALVDRAKHMESHS